MPKISFVVNTSFRHTHVLFYNIKHLSKILSGDVQHHHSAHGSLVVVMLKSCAHGVCLQAARNAFTSQKNFKFVSVSGDDEVCVIGVRSIFVLTWKRMKWTIRHEHKRK